VNLSADDNLLHVAINAKLAEVVDESPTTPSWRDAWRQLGPESTEEERLAVYQAVRDSGDLPAEGGFYLVAWQVDAIASQRAEIELREWDHRLEEIEETHGRNDDGDWPSGSAPAEYDELLERYHSEGNALFIRTLDEVGEREMAQLFTTDRPRFEELSRSGQEYFHGPAAPEWLSDLIADIADCIEADHPMGPLGARYREEDGFWEILVYPTPVELLGGAVDGAVVDPGFSLDLVRFQSIFDRVDDVSWNTHGYHGSEPPFVSVEGVYGGKAMFLRMLSAAPEDEEPGMKFKVNG
jgi:hypothetical protein